MSDWKPLKNWVVMRDDARGVVIRKFRYVWVASLVGWWLRTTHRS